MKKNVLLLILAFVTLNNFAQQEDSLLKNFKFRIDHYRALNFYLNGGSQYNKAVLGLGDQKQSAASAAFGGNYFMLKSTDKILFTATADLGTQINFSKNDYTNNISKYKSFYTQPGVSVSNKWFTKNMFTELGATAYSYLNSSKSTQTGSSLANKISNTDYNFSINVGIGKGRLENITDVQNALWLYKELNASNILTRELTADEQTGLGRAITKGNNTRLLDARRKTKFILKTVDDYLQQSALVSKNDIDYFSSLNDILFFAFNNPRLSGTETFIRVTPQIARWHNTDLNSNNTNIKYEHESTNKTAFLSAGLRTFKPLNLVHQNNYGAILNLAYYDMDVVNRTTDPVNGNVELKSNSISKQAAVNLFFEHAIYPNTRTAINFKLETIGGYQRVENKNSGFGAVYLDGGINYFISYQTRFICNIGVSYQKNMYQFDRFIMLFPNNIRLYANAGVNISI